MYRMTWQLTTISVAILLSLHLTMTDVEARRYRPKSSRPPSGPSTATGTRTGCPIDLGCLKALAPLKHVGQSQLAQPTIAWLVPSHQAHCPTVLSWYRVRNNQPQPILRTELKTQTGINYWQMPSTQALKPGEYVWKTELKCNSDLIANQNPDQNPAVEVAIDILAPTAQADPAELWYDQFASAINQPEQRQQLLDDLVTAEALISDPS